MIFEIEYGFLSFDIAIDKKLEFMNIWLTVAISSKSKT